MIDLIILWALALTLFVLAINFGEYLFCECFCPPPDSESVES